jgi:hypothetical protein|tara:strand:+ start:3391 stop:3582 length:192 start_codon:yes stop_codon:yes gene_type:complete
MSGARDGDDAMEFIEIMNATDGVADDDLDSDGISAPMEHALGSSDTDPDKSVLPISTAMSAIV